MEPNSVCNHTSYSQKKTTIKWETDLLIMRMITDRIEHTVLSTKVEKETRRLLNVFLKKKKNS